ncbi:MAG: branched-chain amino acid ABC transporter permease [Thermincola sp.]|nr:branched-chain amino acid ABC transporter permease [Thermincola sp.]
MVQEKQQKYVLLRGDYFMIGYLLMAGLAVGVIYALLSSGFVLVFKCTGVFNLAYPSLVLLGAYITYTLIVSLGLPPLLAILISVVFGFLIGFVIERLCLRPMIGEPLISILILTIGLSEVLKGISGVIWGSSERVFPQIFPTTTLTMGGYSIPQLYVWVTVTCLIIYLILMLFYGKSSLGLQMRAVASQQDWASLQGINPKRVFALSWGIAAAVGSVAGVYLALMVSLNQFMEPFVLKSFPAAVLGGMDSIPGALVGGLIVGLLETFAGGYLDPILGGGAKDVVAFVILILVLLIKPYGLFGTEEIERL